MDSLLKLGKNTYVLQCDSNVGFYQYNENNICLIDTGSSKQEVNKIIEILEYNQWNLTTIVNTHSHADHIAGNKILQEKYGCRIYSNINEIPFINNTLLTSALFYGSNPISDLKNPFLMGENSNCYNINKLYIPGIKTIELFGHSIGSIGVLTSDDVLFVGDAYTSIENLKRYSLQYVFDVGKYLKSLSFLKCQNFSYYVASHDIVREEIADVIKENIDNCNIIIKNILELINDGITYDSLIKGIFKKYNIKMNVNQYFLISSNLKAYLTFLYENSVITFEFKNNDFIIKKLS